MTNGPRECVLKLGNSYEVENAVADLESFFHCM